MTLVLLILPLIQIVYAAKFVDQMSDSVITVLHGSRRNAMVRQCCCDEMSRCYEEAKLQAYDCIQPCWNKVPPVTNQPNQLMMCFEEKKAFIDDIIHCFKTNVKGCQRSASATNMVNDYDYSEMLNLVEQTVKHQVQKFIAAIASDQIKKIMNAANMLGQCVKQCFMEKNRNGFCFDKLGCEPKIDDTHARSAVKRCARQVRWKQEASELCNCASNAGINGISHYCSVLNLMGR